MCWGLQAFLGPSGLNSGWCWGDPRRGSRGGMLETTGADSPAAEAVDGQEARCFLCGTTATVLASFSLLRSRHLLVLLSPCLLCKSSHSAHHPQDEVPGSSPISLHESLLGWCHRFGLAQASPSRRMLPHPPQHGPLLPARPPSGPLCLRHLPLASGPLGTSLVRVLPVPG